MPERRAIAQLLDLYITEGRTAFYAAVRLLVDLRHECNRREVNFHDAWHASGEIYRHDKEKTEPYA